MPVFLSTAVAVPEFDVVARGAVVLAIVPVEVFLVPEPGAVVLEVVRPVIAGFVIEPFVAAAAAAVVVELDAAALEVAELFSVVLQVGPVVVAVLSAEPVVAAPAAEPVVVAPATEPAVAALGLVVVLPTLVPDVFVVREVVVVARVSVAQDVVHR